MADLILYKNISNDENVKTLLTDTGVPVGTNSAVGNMAEVAQQYGLFGNLWHCYLTFLLVSAENRYSLACEMRGDVGGSISELALQDFKEIIELFHSDLSHLGQPILQIVLDYKPYSDEPDGFSVRLSKKISSLADELSKANSAQVFRDILTGFYRENGAGEFALSRAFRVEEQQLLPIKNTDKIRLGDLVGYELAKGKLIKNTEAFLQGKKANNCLLFGGAGTGKSSSVKALLNEYGDSGLRIIELQKHRLKHLNDVIARVRDRNYRFIIFMDDLSFEEFEIEYKYLKAVIEGGLEKKPNNLLIYATSNRRHLIKEEYSDRDSLHGNDTVQEKLSLAARFGETIFFDTPDKREFEEIVKTLAHREGLGLDDEQLLLAANRWEMSHFGKSGRTARQLIDRLKLDSL